MEKNVGGFDRTARLTIGPVLIAFVAAVLTGDLPLDLTGPVGLAVLAVVGVVGAVLTVTGWTQRCPASAALGIDTYQDPDDLGEFEP
jgi:hypothetical protein